MCRLGLLNDNLRCLLSAFLKHDYRQETSTTTISRAISFRLRP